MALNIYKEYVDKLLKDPAQLKTFMRQIMGPPSRELDGQEYEEVRLILALLVPYEESNNQHSWTECYKVGDTKYHVTTWGSSTRPTIVEYLPENT